MNTQKTNNKTLIQKNTQKNTQKTLKTYLFDQHPADVRVEKPFLNGVRIAISVGVAVVRTVVTAPPATRTFDGT